MEENSTVPCLKCMVVVGTRPEAIKLAPVVLCLLKHSEQIQTRLVLTGQHRETVDQVLDAFNLRADIDLNLMERSQTLPHFAARSLEELTAVLQHERPDLVLVEGDTTTVFTASLAAFYQHIRIGHVEAGLRTRDKHSPFPEEINRRLTGALADLHFAPTWEARENLLREQVNAAHIFVTGNPVIDALLMIRTRATAAARNEFPFLGNGRRTLLVTSHRRENHGEPLQRVCRAVSQLVVGHPDIQVVWPVHPSPVVSKVVHDCLGRRERIHLTEPLGYCSFVGVMALCDLILTDSGGVQEEAPAFGKPVLVLRDNTERPEGVSAGTAQLVGTSEIDIVEQVSRLLNSPALYSKMSKTVSPYGDGRAAERIVAAIRLSSHLDSVEPDSFVAATQASQALAESGSIRE
jgi:UDP-N-acetylglucosamine 2-epimerase (non-hydrolysing)